VSSFVEVEEVSKRFAPRLSVGERIAAGLGSAVETRSVHAVDRLSLRIDKGEALGLVGESGCGKSTLGRIIAGIMPPTSGAVRIAGEPVMSTGRNPSKRTTRVQMVFQDPFASLNPRMRIGETIAEGPMAHGLIDRAGAAAYVKRWLDAVGLEPEFASRFPHQFSGGQRQRVAIARALAMQPDVLICDEPVASLDVSIQAQIINLFLKLRRELQLAMLFISHDLGVVRHVADRTAIMYLGRIIEVGETQSVYESPGHPYTRGLLDSIPKLVLADAERVTFRPIQGELPSPLSPPAGCHFHPRCPIAVARCKVDAPELLEAVSASRRVACHLASPVTSLSPA
jgi:oligopeptide/dipeptide ABC transporter ATP-binding protein